MFADARLTLAALALLAAMLLAGWWGRRERIGAVLLLLLSFSWLTVDQRWELRVLIYWNDRHGVTVSDLAGAAGIVIAIVELVRLRRRAPR